MAERVLTLRELNRATLARQLLLQRKRLSPTAVIERLVGMQAQWPPAPYVGIWTRTTSFRREALERELASGAVVKATVMRQTLHLVTRRDYALLRAALSETNFPWQIGRSRSASRRRCARSPRQGPVTTADALAYLEREHGLTGIDARRAWRGGARARAPRCTTTSRRSGAPVPRAGSSRIEEPEAHDPTEARAEIFRRYLAAFGPASRRDIVAWSMMHVPEIEPRARAARAAAPLPRRAGPRAPRRPARAAAGRRDTRAGSLPAEVGQRAAGVGGPDARASGAVPEDGHPHERRRRADVPRRRVRRGHLARRERTRRHRAVRAAVTIVRSEVEDEAERLEAFLAD